MSTATILLRLAAPLQSWGTDDSKFEIRRTRKEPSKSGVIGLIAAAMGVRRDDDKTINRLASMRFGVRVDKEGEIERDYQTVKGKDSYETLRYYLEDACFTVGLESKDETALRKIEEALRHPAFTLFLGRKSCPPVGKVCLGIRQTSLEEALKDEAYLFAGPTRFLFETKPGERGILLRDQPVSFDPTHRKHTFRQAREEILYPDGIFEHDPMAELER